MVLYGSDHFKGAFSPFLWQWMLLYGGVIIVVGQSLWLTGLRASSISTASIVSSFTPIVGIAAAYLILGEVPTVAHYIGGSVILAGLLLSQFGRYYRMERKPTPTIASDNSVYQEQTIAANAGYKGV